MGCSDLISLKLKRIQDIVFYRMGLSYMDKVILTVTDYKILKTYMFNFVLPFTINLFYQTQIFEKTGWLIYRLSYPQQWLNILLGIFNIFLEIFFNPTSGNLTRVCSSAESFDKNAFGWLRRVRNWKDDVGASFRGRGDESAQLLLSRRRRLWRTLDKG